MNTNDKSAAVAVEQVDREAADKAFDIAFRSGTEGIEEAMSELFARHRLASQTAGDDVMVVIDPNEWEPCSPAYLSCGGLCSAPRVWNDRDKNHWHPKLDATPEPQHSGDEVES